MQCLSFCLQKSDVISADNENEIDSILLSHNPIDLNFNKIFLILCLQWLISERAPKRWHLALL